MMVQLLERRVRESLAGSRVDSIGVGYSSKTRFQARKVLKSSFANQVTLTGVATLFVSDHAGFGTGFPDVSQALPLASTINFEISTNGTTWSDVLFINANKNILSITSSTFYFRQDAGTSNPSLTNGVMVTAVPEPETYAMLLAGLGAARVRGAPQEDQGSCCRLGVLSSTPENPASAGFLFFGAGKNAVEAEHSGYKFRPHP